MFRNLLRVLLDRFDRNNEQLRRDIRSLRKNELWTAIAAISSVLALGFAGVSVGILIHQGTFDNKNFYLEKKKENLEWTIHHFQDDSIALYHRIDSLILLSGKFSTYLKNELKAHEKLKYQDEANKKKYSDFKDSIVEEINNLNKSKGFLELQKASISEGRADYAQRVSQEPAHIKYWTDSVKKLNVIIDSLKNRGQTRP